MAELGRRRQRFLVILRVARDRLLRSSKRRMKENRGNVDQNRRNVQWELLTFRSLMCTLFGRKQLRFAKRGW